MDNGVILDTDKDFDMEPGLRGNKKDEELNNLLRHPGDPEIREGVEQEQDDEIGDLDNQNESVEQTLDQGVEFMGLELEAIISYSFEEGALHFLVKFTSGKECAIPYTDLREDYLL